MHTRREQPQGTHSYEDDPRNKDIFIGIRDGVSGRFELVPRLHAKVSVLDSGFMLVSFEMPYSYRIIGTRLVHWCLDRTLRGGQTNEL